MLEDDWGSETSPLTGDCVITAPAEDGDDFGVLAFVPLIGGNANTHGGDINRAWGRASCGAKLLFLVSFLFLFVVAATGCWCLFLAVTTFSAACTAPLCQWMAGLGSLLLLFVAWAFSRMGQEFDMLTALFTYAMALCIACWVLAGTYWALRSTPDTCDGGLLVHAKKVLVVMYCKAGLLAIVLPLVARGKSQLAQKRKPGWDTDPLGVGSDDDDVTLVPETTDEEADDPWGGVEAQRAWERQQARTTVGGYSR